MNPTTQLLEPEVMEMVRDGKWDDLRTILPSLPSADVADILASLPPQQAVLAFRVLPRDDAAAVFSYLEGPAQESLIASLGDAGAVRVIEDLPVDDRARLLDELPPDVAKRFIGSLSPQARKETQAILGYKPGTVGRLMTTDLVTLRAEWTVAQSLEHVRTVGRDAETINVLYVVDEGGRLIDDLRLRQLLFAQPTALVSSLMNQSFVTLRADQSEDEAVALMARYDRTALPVVDGRGALIGIVTHDDVADVAQQEATESMQKFGGMEALDVSYATASIKELVSKRGKSLAVLFLGEMLTASAMTHYNTELEHAVVLGLFLPLIISSGGNSGSQATTLIIRSLALQEITTADWLRVFRRELLCAGLLGLFLAVIGFVRIVLWTWLGWGEAYGPHYVLIGATVAASLIGVVLWGSLMGAMLPFVLRKMRLDPATISAPLVATMVDVTGLIIYFTCAAVLLKGTVL